jgi:hypothetical protein
MSISISGCGSILNQNMPVSDRRINVSKVKKIIIKKLSFLPYVDYVPDVEPKEPGLILLDELQRYESIVDDHVMFELAEEKKFYGDSKKRLKLIRFIKRKKINDTIEEKVLDIEEIRKLTSRYQNWSLGWDDKATLVGKELSIDEIDLIKSEIKRISRKL